MKMSNKYAEISKVKISTLNKNGKTILDDVYFTSYAMIQLKQNQNANELLKICCCILSLVLLP